MRLYENDWHSDLENIPFIILFSNPLIVMRNQHLKSKYYLITALDVARISSAKRENDRVYVQWNVIIMPLKIQRKYRGLNLYILIDLYS